MRANASQGIPLTLMIIAATAIVFVLQGLLPVTDTIAFTPSLFYSGFYWQPLTYLLTHGGIFHIFINMFVLFIFGLPVEQMLGKKKFLFLYLVSGIGSALLYLAITGFAENTLVGASGAVYGVVTAFAFKRPKEIIWIFPGIPLPAAGALGAIIVIELVAGIANLEPGVANFGHLGGIITAAIIMLAWRFSGRTKRAQTFHGLEFAWE